jgi:hypothetical protein
MENGNRKYNTVLKTGLYFPLVLFIIQSVYIEERIDTSDKTLKSG